MKQSAWAEARPYAACCAFPFVAPWGWPLALALPPAAAADALARRGLATENGQAVAAHLDASARLALVVARVAAGQVARVAEGAAARAARACAEPAATATAVYEVLESLVFAGWSRVCDVLDGGRASCS